MKSTLAGGVMSHSVATASSKKKKDSGDKKIKPIPFGDRPGLEGYHASEIVAIADSRFLFCDNNIGDSLFELRLNPDGEMESSLIERHIDGLEENAVDDLEGMALVEQNGRRFIFAIPS